jgi:hypothetical protein
VQGLSGHEYADLSPECKVPPPYMNWNEILPYRAQNFWTGSTTCPTEENFVTYDTSTGKLVVDGNSQS